MDKLAYLLSGLILLNLSVTSYAKTYPCEGAGCCCNVQPGGTWPDCSEGYECRGMVDPPRISVCVKKGSPANTSLFLASNQPAGCYQDEPQDEEVDDKKTKDCHGEGCCCQVQNDNKWPDCDEGFECRQATQKPYVKVCVAKGAVVNKPLFIASSQPKHCLRKPQSKANSRADRIRLFCDPQPNAAAREWCRRHVR